MEEDSFQQCKGELEKELGITDIPAPNKPMNAYMRYYLERSSEFRANGHNDFTALGSQIAAEWGALPANKRQYYQQIYQIRRREHQELQAQYDLLTKRKKVLSPYSRFIKRRYLQYSREYPTKPHAELNKLANQDWRKLPLTEKDRLKEEVEKEREDAELDLDRDDRIEEYKANLDRYNQQIKQDKERVLRKYGLSATDKAQTRKRVEETRSMIKDIQVSFSKKNSRANAKKKTLKQNKRVQKIVERQLQKEKRAIKAQLEELRRESRKRKPAEADQENEKQEENVEKTKKISKDVVVSKNGETFLRMTRSKK